MGAVVAYKHSDRQRLPPHFVFVHTEIPSGSLDGQTHRFLTKFSDLLDSVRFAFDTEDPMKKVLQAKSLFDLMNHMRPRAPDKVAIPLLNYAASFLVALFVAESDSTLIARLLGAVECLALKFTIALDGEIDSVLADKLASTFRRFCELRSKIVIVLTAFDCSIPTNSAAIVSIVLDEFPGIDNTHLLFCLINLFYEVSWHTIDWGPAARVLGFLSTVSHPDIEGVRIWTVFNLIKSHPETIQEFLDGTPFFSESLQDSFNRHISDDADRAVILCFGQVFGRNCHVPNFDPAILWAALEHGHHRVQVAACNAATNFMLSTENQEFAARLLDRFIEMLIAEDHPFVVKQELAAAFPKVLTAAVPLTAFEALLGPDLVDVVGAVAGISGLALIELFEALIEGAEKSGTVQLFARVFDACDGEAMLEAIKVAAVEERADEWMARYRALLDAGE
jgi:hypothetical protein